MTLTPLMPMATAVWLVENTTLTFKQIAEFCNLHEVEVQGIADGEVAKGIKAYNPITSGQLTKEEIELSSKDQNRALRITNTDVEISSDENKIKSPNFPLRLSTELLYIGFNSGLHKSTRGHPVIFNLPAKSGNTFSAIFPAYFPIK